MKKARGQGKLVYGLAASALVLMTSGLWAQGGPMMQGHSCFSGTIAEISAAAVTAQGATLALSGDTSYIGEDASGNLLALTPADFNVGDLVTAFAENENGTQTATALYRGLPFMIQGSVTALQDDGQGNQIGRAHV